MPKEPLRECMFCGRRVAGRGMFNHVTWNDGPHGPEGETPDSYDIADCKIVGLIDVEMNKANEHREHDRYACNHCDEVFHGKRGLTLHLTGASDPLHPDMTADEVVHSEHRRFPATRDGRILVPDPAYRHVIHLTEAEQSEFTIEVDERLKSAEEIEAGRRDDQLPEAVQMADPDKERLVDSLRAHYMEMLDDHSSGTDPIKQFDQARRAIVGAHQ